MPDRFQFSVRFLLLLTALVSLTIAVFAWKPSLYSLAARAGLTIVIASLAVLASVFAEGTRRAFWIGVAVPTVLAVLAYGQGGLQIAHAYRALGAHFDQQVQVIAEVLRSSVVLWTFAPINGLLCAMAYRLLGHGRARPSAR